MKTRYNTLEKLNSKTTPLLIIVSSISVLLLMIYFGVSLTSKGTFTLDESEVPNNDVRYYCSNGHNAQQAATGANYYCCEDFSFQSFFDPSYCVSAFHSSNNDGSSYCFSEDTNFCNGLDSSYYPQIVVDESNEVCKYLCQVPATLPTSCTINGEEGIVDKNGICQYESSNVPIYCTEYGEFVAGIDANALIIKKNGCDTCPPGWDWNPSNTQCQTTLYSFDTESGYAYYYNNDVQMTCADGYRDVIADGEHICKQEFTCSYGSITVGNSNKIVGTLTNNSNAIVCCLGIGWYNDTDSTCATTIDNVNHRYRTWAGNTKCINVGNDTYERSGEWCTLGDPVNNIPELESIDKDRCNVVSNQIVRIATCEKMRNGTTCSDNENKDKLCYMSNGTTIKRCDLAPEDSPICLKKCKYCSNGVEKVDSSVPNRGQTCSAYHDGYHEYSETLNCSPATTNQKTCYKCTANSTTPLDGQFDTCTGEWSETVPNCSKTCKYCSNGEEKTVSNVPELLACSTYHDGYHEYNETLNCSSTPGTITQKTCYKCTANSTAPLNSQFDTCTGEWSETVPNCSKTCKYCSNGEEKTVGNVPKLKDCSAYHDGYHEYSETLNCSSDTNNNNTTTTTSNNSNVTDNAQTGSSAVIIAWIIGLTAIGYAFYYFRQTSSNS